MPVDHVGVFLGELREHLALDGVAPILRESGWALRHAAAGVEVALGGHNGGDIASRPLAARAAKTALDEVVFLTTRRPDVALARLLE
jgi:hypothetical protein